MTVLFLYSELADYFLKCCDELSATNEVHIIRWPVNNEAPFHFNFSEKIKVYDKKMFSENQLSQLASKINPDIIVCSGWVDRDYLSLTKRYFKKIPTVLTCDTQWRGSLKQYLAVFLSPFFLLNTFSHAWVPGEIQAKYLNKLGFKKGIIKKKFYCCDLTRFNAIYNKQKNQKHLAFPKRFLYVGRYYNFKGITDLWEAFIELKAENSNDWELWCLGVGDITPIKHPHIKHFGFVQPKDLEPILSQCGVFVLPSRFEPWGVVVQEYAAAGLPLLLSNSVGAKEVFLEESKNGYSFLSGNVSNIKQHLKKITELSDKELLLMSEKSNALAQQINLKDWANTLSEIYDDYRKN